MFLIRTIKRLNFRTPRSVNFPFGTNGKLSILGVQIFKHMMVFEFTSSRIMLVQILHKDFQFYQFFFFNGW